MDSDIIKKEQDWEKSKNEFYYKQQLYNKSLDALKEQFMLINIEAVVKVFELFLEKSKYPFFFKKEVVAEYNLNNKILIVDYRLPTPENLPTLKAVKYVISSDEIREHHITRTQLLKLYDGTIYKIILRSINELFTVDTIEILDVIVFNGWVKTFNKATGNKEKRCIASIQIKKKEFKEVNLTKVEPKICFKSFKGIKSSNISDLVAIQPLIQIKKEDKRFVDSLNVEFDCSTNLALMDWEDFEHLIRELFEKEFSSNGGEVKVTQASRDGGVDAIAFDPDPIRGGKIVIQAKRYTNTVGVSAVRDLFGTIMNEGANKGILVTTSDYGTDSYEFAKGKPITLLNGANLLYLLEKHGTRAKIDIKDAKRTLTENRKNQTGRIS